MDDVNAQLEQMVRGTGPPAAARPEGVVFSVVIPAYNAAEFIARAIDSALVQHVHKEILVVDDGSTDATAEAVGRYPSVRYIRQEHAGASAARNCGISHARGEYVAFLDADDQWLPGHLERALAIFRADPGLRWYCAEYQDRDAAGREMDATRRRRTRKFLAGGRAFDDSLAAQARGVAFSTLTMVLRRDVLNEVGMFSEDFTCGEDIDLWFRVALRHPRIGYSAECGGVYWHRAGSATSGRQADKLHSLLRRIARDEQIAYSAGRQAVRRAQALVRRWLRTAVHLGIQGRLREPLEQVALAYGRRVPPRQRAASWLCRHSDLRWWRLWQRLA